jgi:hypothetical protein
VVDVSDRPDVYVRLPALKFLFGHRIASFSVSLAGGPAQSISPYFSLCLNN